MGMNMGMILFRSGRGLDEMSWREAELKHGGLDIEVVGADVV